MAKLLYVMNVSLDGYIAREVFAALQPLRHEFLTPPT